MIITQSLIIKSILDQALKTPEIPVLGTIKGQHMVSVLHQTNMGMSSRLPGTLTLDETFSYDSSATTHSMAEDLNLQNTSNACWGLAAVNSLLNHGSPGTATKVQKFIYKLGAGKNVAIIGHFPFVEKMDHLFKNFWVLELNPRNQDIHENMKDEILPRADIVAITATTLLNDTLGQIINLAGKSAVKIILGPSTPLAPCLFDMGIDYLGGAIVHDHEQTIAGIRSGLPFRKICGARTFLTGKNKT